MYINAFIIIILCYSRSDVEGKKEDHKISHDQGEKKVCAKACNDNIKFCVHYKFTIGRENATT